MKVAGDAEVHGDARVSLMAYLVGETLLRSRAAARLTAHNGAAKSTRKPGRMKRALAGLVPQFKGEVDSIQRDLMRAGYYGSTAFVDYMATRNVLMVAIAITTGVLAVLADPVTSLPRRRAWSGRRAHLQSSTDQVPESADHRAA